MGVVHDHRGGSCGVIEPDLTNPGRSQRVLDQLDRVVRVRDDVDPLTLELIGDHPDAAATRSNAGPHRVDMRIVRPHGDLGPMTGLPCRSPNLDNARRDLRDLELKEALHKTWVGPAHDDLRALGGLAYFDDVRLEACTVLVALIGHLLRLRHQGFLLAKVEQRVAVVGLLDDSGHDVTLATGVLVVLHVPLDLADALHDDLLGRLGSDPTEVLRRVIPLSDHIALEIELLAIDLDLAVVGVDGDHGLLGGVR